jgi:hypothetical protein
MTVQQRERVHMGFRLAFLKGAFSLGHAVHVPLRQQRCVPACAALCVRLYVAVC